MTETEKKYFDLGTETAQVFDKSRKMLLKEIERIALSCFDEITVEDEILEAEFAEYLRTADNCTIAMYFLQCLSMRTIIEDENTSIDEKNEQIDGLLKKLVTIGIPEKFINLEIV